jgi:hypothetical protein
VLPSRPSGHGFGPPGPSGVVVGPTVDISRAPGNQAETSVAIDPNDTQRVFAVSNNLSGSTAFAAYSTDGGTTWTRSNLSAIPASCCDQQVAWDGFGNLFMVYLTASNGDAVVARSIDGGATFIDPRTVVRSADQPSIAVGPSGVDGVPGSVWISTTNSSNRIVAAGAPVMGLGMVGTFGTPEVAPGPGGDFGGIAIGPNGQVMVTYQDNGTVEGPDTIKVNLDPDGLGPAGFGPVVIPTSTNVGGFAGIPAQPDRDIDAEANLAWDRSGGPHNGRAWLVYTDRPSITSADTDIFVRYSDDNGATWSPRVRVNDDTGTNSQFNPAIALDQTTGNVAVTWYDCRNSPTNNTAQVWGAISSDGETFGPNFQISAGSSNGHAAGSFNSGDFDTMDFTNGVMFRTWADNSPELVGNPDRPNMDMATARVQVAVAGPSVVNSSPSGDTFGTVSSVRVRFDEQIDPATFTLAQVDSFTRTDADGVTDLLPSLSAITPVAGSNNRQFDLTFASQSHLGRYALTIGPDILDTAGRPMDQNHNGIPGEIPDDEYTATFSLQAPKVIASTPAGTSHLPGELISSATVTFNEPIDPTTFTPDKIFGFRGPDGLHPIRSVAPIPGSGNTSFTIGFDPLAVSGRYTMLVGPDIRDLAGHQMDQNGNFIPGEIPDDMYVLTFGVQGLRVNDAATALNSNIPGRAYRVHVQFNEPADPTRFTAGTIDLEGPDGNHPILGVVPTSSDYTAFDLVTAPLTMAGAYTLSFGPGIPDAFGNLMDQDGDLVPGESSDAYSAVLSVTTPQVLHTDPVGTVEPAVDRVRVTFDRPMDPTQFDPAQFSLTGPAGSVPVTAITAVPQTFGTQFDVTFPAQGLAGAYALTLQGGADLYGNPLGEYTASFSLAAFRLLSVSPNGTVRQNTDHVRVTLDRPAAVDTFGTDQVSLTGPGGPVAVTGIVPVAGTNNTQFDIQFTPLSQGGMYTLQLSPDIQDAYGNPLSAAPVTLNVVEIPAETHEYLLQNTYADTHGGPSIVPNGGTLSANGYAFAEDQGPSLSGAIDASNYSIEMVFRIDDNSGYRKIIDFSNRTVDRGLYDLNGDMIFYGASVTGTPGAMTAGVSHHLVVTRDGTTRQFVAYLDGVRQFTFTDSSGLAMFSGPNRIIYFLRDDAAPPGSENPSGVLTRVRIYDTPLTPEQALALYLEG